MIMKLYVYQYSDRGYMKIIYETENGISIIHPTGELSIEEVFNKDVPEKYKHTAQIVEDEFIPTDRTFRNAWEFAGVDLVNKTAVRINIDKAKEIHKERLRAERKPLLEAQDVLFMMSLEMNDDKKKSEVLTEKQRLRDITKLVDKCETIDEIKSVTINGMEIADADTRDTII